MQQHVNILLIYYSKIRRLHIKSNTQITVLNGYKQNRIKEKVRHLIFSLTFSPLFLFPLMWSYTLNRTSIKAIWIPPFSWWQLISIANKVPKEKNQSHDSYTCEPCFTQQPKCASLAFFIHVTFDHILTETWSPDS